MQAGTDEPEIIQRVAALDVGKAEVVCCQGRVKVMNAGSDLYSSLVIMLR